ncbi:MAG: hypothetical protein OEV72_14000, partial [Thermoleophilia bacterium]|nr:hypothetical protein [Thermoleophilia bacterium]
MFDAFPFDEWSEDIGQFWTFAGESGTSAGTWIMTALGFTVMLVAFWGFVILENRKLTHQASRLKASGALDPP